jgi:hypothetical protein
MPNVNDLGESKHLKTGDLPEPVAVTIMGYDRQNVAKENEPPAMKYVLKLRGDSKKLPTDKDGNEKPMTLNKTNGNRIAKITGEGDFDKWIGKQVEIYHDPMVEFKGEIVGGIRVRPVSGQAQPEAVQVYETAKAVDEEIPF